MKTLLVSVLIETITENPIEYIKPVQHSMFLQPCDDAEILHIVQLLSSYKPSGFGDISPTVILCRYIP